MKTGRPPARLAFSKEESSRRFTPSIQNTPLLPQVNWADVGQSAPQPLDTPQGGLPAADVVVVTWAEAEWAAMEHVFCGSANTMPYSARNEENWSGWEKFAKGVPDLPHNQGWNYWGNYKLVKIAGKAVLLFKSNTHLDFPGEQYLAQMTSLLISNSKPQLVLSIGTAGGARPGDHIGTVNVVNAGTLYVSGQAQSEWPEYSNGWTPDWSIVQQADFQKLLFPVPTTENDLESLCNQFNSSYGTDYSLNQLNVNNLNLGGAEPAINNLTGAATSLLTTDSFVVATSAGNFKNFACVEMDDAIVAKVCSSHHQAFGSVRNISDPVQNSDLPPKAQGNWGSTVYDAYGLYTSYNGALAAWALIAAS
jgi:nucleoside phosphorylase